MKKTCAMVGVLIGILITGLIVNAKKSEMQGELAEQVFRFHVLANSDSGEDQALKMKVKEAIIAYMKQELPESDSVETTKKWARENLVQIEQVAAEIIEEEGYEYSVKAEDGILKGGTIYEPESGTTYYAKISYNEADNTITLRGSLDRRGWVGRSQTWIKERK